MTEDQLKAWRDYYNALGEWLQKVEEYKAGGPGSNPPGDPPPPPGTSN